MWETRLENLEKNEKSAQQCRLFCIRATLALFTTSFPPSPEAIQLLSNFCDVILKLHPQMTPSQFLRWLKLSKNTLLMIDDGDNTDDQVDEKKEAAKNEKDHIDDQKLHGDVSPKTSSSATPSPSSSKSPAVVDDLSPIRGKKNDDIGGNNECASCSSGVVQQHQQKPLPWDCVFLQGWIRSELGVATRTHVAWCDLPQQRALGWKIDANLQ